MKEFGVGRVELPRADYDLKNPNHLAVVADNWAHSILWRASHNKARGVNTDPYGEAKKAGRILHSKELPKAITGLREFRKACEESGKVYVGVVR